MSEVFKGSVGEYTVVGEKEGAKWGVNVQLDENQRIAVRFAAVPVPTNKPTHFNFRGPSVYGVGVTGTPGCRFDKVNIPLVQKKVAPAHLLKMIEKMDIVSIVGEYIARQFSKEGVNFNADFSSEPKTVDLVRFCKLGLAHRGMARRGARWRGPPVAGRTKRL